MIDARDPGIVDLTRDLCAYRTGVVARGNDDLFARIAREVPVDVHRVPSGEAHLGWEVPDLWEVEEALVEGPGGLVVDAAAHPLGVAELSRSFEGTLERGDLDAHLVSSAALPDAHVYHCRWQYRPWEAGWALSIPHRVRAALPQGHYRIRLHTTRSAGHMLVADLEHAGESDATIVFNSHTCHPHMANDGMVGVATLIRLFQWLAGRRTRYTYRMVLGPEHLGTVFYLRDREPADVARLVGGAFVEMTGVPAPLRVASSFLGGQGIDRAVAHALRSGGADHVAVGWRRGAGNDETVWEAPGYEVPFVEMTRCVDTFDPYPEYHTDLDTPDRLDGARVDEAFRVLVGLVEALEADCVAHRRFDGLPCLSAPGVDLYPERPDPALAPIAAGDDDRWGRLVDRALRLMDGRTTAMEMADEAGLPVTEVRRWLDRFAERGLARVEPAWVTRPPASLRDPEL